MKKFFLMLLAVTPISALFIEAAHITAARATSPTGATLSPTGANIAAISPNSLNSTQIMQIQQTLRNDGFIVNLDGVWGPSVTTALQQFQVARGLPGSGTLTAQTVTSLGVDLGPTKPVPGIQGQGTIQGSATSNNALNPAAGATAGAAATTPLGAAGTGANTTTSGTAKTNGMSGTATGAVSGGAGAPPAAGGTVSGSAAGSASGG